MDRDGEEWTAEERQAFVERLACELPRFFSSASWRYPPSPELTLGHRWTYPFDLVKSAIKAGATSLRIEVRGDGDGVVVQHDGPDLLTADHVRGLSCLSNSTSEGRSVMSQVGCGLNSAFGRFTRAAVSGNGWAIRYEFQGVPVEPAWRLEPHSLRVVVPLWDPSIAPPDSGFTMRFSLEGNILAERDLVSGLAQLFPDHDFTPLAILAWSGLRRLWCQGVEWDLQVEPAQTTGVLVTATSDSERLAWRLFPFPEQGSQEQTALGILPLDSLDRPAPPSRGRAYAVLPTDAILPFGMHIHANWSVHLSHTGLHLTEGSNWHGDIVDSIPNVMRRFLQWIPAACGDKESVKAAFRVFAPPHLDSTNGLGEFLADEAGLTRLKGLFEEIPFIPVCTDQDDAPHYVTPHEALLPPEPLAAAFEEEPALLPSVLLRSPVLDVCAMGQDARAFFEQVGLLTCMEPCTLDQAWKHGLEAWWSDLAGDETQKRDLLLRLWGAMASLCLSRTWWRKCLGLRYVRTAAGEWLHVAGVSYCKDALPSDDEPGGREVRLFLEARVPDIRAILPHGWYAELQQRAYKGRTYLQARQWIDAHATEIVLCDVLREALEQECARPTPDWSILIPLGRWAMSRGRRHNLLSHVLVETPEGPQPVPVAEALVADPYVEHGEIVRHMFAGLPAIVPDYLEGLESRAGAKAWRDLFERAGARGVMVFEPGDQESKHESRAHEQYEFLKWKAERDDRGRRLDEFLGLGAKPDGRQVSLARLLGLTAKETLECGREACHLLGVRFNSESPVGSAPLDVRWALFRWLAYDHRQWKRDRPKTALPHDLWESGFVKEMPTTWVEWLRYQSWVPCSDGDLRRPEAILARADPGRPREPWAVVPTDLVSLLERIGVQFGVDVPKATATDRLIALSADSTPEELVSLLKEARPATGDSREGLDFVQALAQVSVPCRCHSQRHGSRVLLSRVVRHLGRPFRNSLDEWVVPVNYLEPAVRAELENPDCPYPFPETTTGFQALEYLEDVWKHSRTRDAWFVHSVMRVLPDAYSYVATDIFMDHTLGQRWDDAVLRARVFTQQQWHDLENGQVYFDDLEDHRLLPEALDVRLAEEAHLGKDREQQRKVAYVLSMPLLSELITKEWKNWGLQGSGAWGPRFKRICKLLARVQPTTSDEADHGIAVFSEGLSLQRARLLELHVRFNPAPPEVVQVNAHLDTPVLMVAGEPAEFCSDAAHELLRSCPPGQKATLAASLTGLFAAIDDARAFTLAEKKFARAFTSAPRPSPPLEWDRQELAGVPGSPSWVPPKERHYRQWGGE